MSFPSHVQGLTKRHFEALRKISAAGHKGITIDTDTQRNLFWNIMQIDAGHPGKFVEITGATMTSVTVTAIIGLGTIIYNFDHGYYKASFESGTGVCPIHQWFGLGRDSYVVMPRLALQSMSKWWKQKFVDLMTEIEEVGIRGPSEYDVTLPDGSDDPWADYRHGDAWELSK